MAQVSLFQILGVFLKLGSIGFGGPVALIALMESECGRRRKWFTTEEFQRAYLFCKLLPGPVAYQMSVWIGYHLRGRRGGLVAGTAFVLPSALMILILSHLYAEVTALSGWQRLFEGLRIGALAVIALSLVQLSKPLGKAPTPWAFVVASLFLMGLFPAWEPLIIVGCGILSILLARSRRIRGLKAILPFGLLAQIFWMHLKAGAFVFGTGLAIVPLLQQDVVGRYGWLTLAEFLDGIAFGQVTPGPVTITSAFVGYRVAGLPGAGSALLGMYLPGLFFIMGFMPWVRGRAGNKPWLGEFQKGAVPAVVGCLIAASLWLARETLVDAFSVLTFFFLMALAWRLKIPALVLIPLGSLLAVLF